MKKIAQSLIFVLMLMILIAPVLSLAQSQNSDRQNTLIPCGTSDKEGNIANPCDFNGFMALINNVINFTLFKLALPLAAIMFVYAGFKMVTSGGSAEARGQAKRIFTSVAIGLILAAGAWLIISTLLSVLGYEGSWIGLKIGL